VIDGWKQVDSPHLRGKIVGNLTLMVAKGKKKFAQ
jgi:hypothetical protein